MYSNPEIPINNISEPTIQGEGSNVGRKTVFVRVQGCDYKCPWCDSKETWGKSGTLKQTRELSRDILQLLKKHGIDNIVLTGGNPCLYDFGKFIDIFTGHHKSVAIETQGSIIPYWLSKCELVTFSPKPPSFENKDVLNNIINFIELVSVNETNCEAIDIKIPIINEEDIIFAKKYLAVVKMANSMLKQKQEKNLKHLRLYLSVGNTNINSNEPIRDDILEAYEKLIDEVVHDKELDSVYVLPQLHTLVWGNKKGV